MMTHDIKKTLEFLIHYEDINLTHTFDEYILSYSRLGGFRLENTLTGLIDTYKEIESCSAKMQEIFSAKGVLLLPSSFK